MAENNKLVKTSGRKVTLKYNSPYVEPEVLISDPYAHILPQYRHLYENYTGGPGGASAGRIPMTREERFLSEFADCLPIEKRPGMQRGGVKGTLAEIQAYGYLQCGNGLTLWQNWLRYG